MGREMGGAVTSFPFEGPRAEFLLVFFQDIGN